MLSSKHMAEMLRDAIQRGADPIELADALADKMLASSVRMQLPHALFYLKEFAAREKEENTFRIESATKLSPTKMTEISKAFGAEKNMVENIVDPSLVSGFRIRHRDFFYDATLSTRLEKLKEALI